jgi:acyl-CoA-binding protein
MSSNPHRFPEPAACIPPLEGVCPVCGVGPGDLPSRRFFETLQRHGQADGLPITLQPGVARDRTWATMALPLHAVDATMAMADLKQQFEGAVARSKALDERPDNMTLLKIYALYKQATAGDAQGERPGLADMVGRAKWDAWHALAGRSKEAAMQSYVELIESLE